MTAPNKHNGTPRATANTARFREVRPNDSRRGSCKNRLDGSGAAVRPPANNCNAAALSGQASDRASL